MNLASPKAKANWRRRRRDLFNTLFSPPPRITVSEWADQYRMLSRENCAEPGPWRTDRVPYMREIMDTANDPMVEEVVFKKSAQVAATEGANNIIGYFSHQDPSPILVVQTTEGEAEKYSKEKLAPMIRDSPKLAEIFEDAKSRDSDNTILAKKFLGGHLGIVGANAPSGLRMRTRRVVIFDEFAGYPISAGTEGDPVMLGKARAQTFWNRKFYLFSTPTLKGDRVDTAYESSDQRRYHVPCPHCLEKQVLNFQKGMIWEKREYKLGEGPGDVPVEWGIPIHRWDLKKGTAMAHYPDTAQYVCQKCGVVIEESEKITMLAQGTWVAAFPGRRVRGYHISALYSPWVRWGEIAREFLETLDHPEKLRPFVNLKLGENFEEQREGLTSDVLAERCEPYAAEVPSGVGVLTAAVDVQDDRLELKVKGWGADEESWLIRLQTFEGDPGSIDVWNRLDVELIRAFQHEDGAQLKIRSVAIDSGGHHADAVYKFARARRGRSLFVIKGSSTPSSPVWPAKRPKPGKFGVRVWLVGTDTAKDIILLSRVRRAAPGPGFMHYPEGTPADYFEQLTSEAKGKAKGSTVVKWHKKTGGARNEALDLEVYNLGALRGLGRAVYEHLDREVSRVLKAGEKRKEMLAAAEANPETPPAEEPRKAPRARRPRGWVRSW